MNILNVNSYYFSSTVHRQLQQSLLKRKLNVFTYAPVSRGYIPREECRYRDNNNFKKVECYNEIDRYVFHIKHRKILRNLIKEIDINYYRIIHAHSLFSNGYIAMKIKETYGIPYVVTMRDTDINTFFRKMTHLRNMGNKILREARAVVFLSKSYRNSLINKYVKDYDKNDILSKTFVIPSGIDEFWFENTNMPKKLKSKEKISLLHVGAINKRKNILTTLKVVELLKKKGYDITFTVVGKVVDNEVYEIIQKSNFVNYVSPKPKEELLRIYRESHIFVMPSITETFGLVYPEAMSQGLPVIYTKEQGFDGHFDDGEVGYRVNCFQVEELSNKIEEIINDYEGFSSRCITNVEKFRWENISEQYQVLYEKLF